MHNKCGVCKETITRDKEIHCFGICSKSYHSKCTGLNTNAIKSICEFERLKYVCVECELVSNKVILNKVINMIEKLESKQDNLQGNSKVVNIRRRRRYKECRESN